MTAKLSIELTEYQARQLAFVVRVIEDEPWRMPEGALSGRDRAALARARMKLDDELDLLPGTR